MTTINASVPSGGVAADQPWRNHVLTATDGYRAVLYSDGTNLHLATAKSGQTGETWADQGTVVAAISVTDLMDWVYDDTALYVVIATSTSTGGSVNGATLYVIPYTGAGVFNVAGLTAITLAPVTGTTYSAPPLSVRALYDPSGTTVDPQHTAGTTGLIHVLVDLGATWYLHALDVHSAVTPCKLLYSSSVSSGVDSATGATNALVRTANKVYAITPGRSAWAAHEITWSSTQGAPNGPGSFAPAGGTVFTGPSWPVINHWYSDMDGVDVSALTPPTTHGATLYTVPTGGASWPGGTWQAKLSMTCAIEISAYVTCRTRIYTVSAGVKTLVGTLVTTSTFFLFKDTVTLSCSATLPGFPMLAGDSIYAEAEFEFLTFGNPVHLSAGTITVSKPTLTCPKPTVGTNNVVNGYAASATEAPALFLSPYGAALCQGGTSSNPPVDLFVYNSSTAAISTVQRYAGGGYSGQTSIGGTGLVAQGVAASFDTVSGNEDVLALAAFGGINHIGALKKTGGTGLWASIVQVDTAGSAVSGQFGAVSPARLSLMGPAVIYVPAGGSGGALVYEDGGYAASQTAPTIPDHVQLVDDGTGDVFGDGTPFNTTTTKPTVGWTYHHANPSDHMGAYRVIVKQGVTTIWDSTQTGLASGPVDGQTFQVQIPVALTVGTTYTATVQDWDVLSGQASPVSSAITFTVVAAPLVFLDGPTDVTSFTPTYTIGFWQTNAYGESSVQLQFLDGSGAVATQTAQIGFAADLQPTTLSASALAAASTIQTHQSIPNGQKISMGALSDATHEYVIASTSVSNGDGTYTVTLGTPLVHGYASGVRVYACYDVVPNLWPALGNALPFTAVALAWVDPPTAIGGANWDGTASVQVVTDFPAPPAVTDLSVLPVPGVQQFEGGYLQLHWQLPTPGLGEVDAVTINVRSRATGTTAWTLASPQLAASYGAGACKLWSIANDIPQDMAVSTVSSQGVESDFTIVTDVDLVFRLGLWLNDPATPTTCLELGRVLSSGGGGSYPMGWEWLVQKDVAILYNRSAPAVTSGTLLARHSANASSTSWTLDRGSELATLAQLQAWLLSGIDLMIRDPFGNVLFGTILAVVEGAGVHRGLRTVTVELQQTDTSPYSTVLTV